ncbi:MAG: hypothetical protein H0T79_01065 [Deltaproteobacteria bacterium]|nr:hypothetical protein [Deltaproteobacteria bacterium]
MGHGGRLGQGQHQEPARGTGAKKLGSEVAELAAGAAHAVGKIANEAGKGAFAGSAPRS